MKRLFDFILSISILILVSPIILLLFILVAYRLGCPALFIQQRPGMNGKLFRMVKFRSMTDDKDALGGLLSDGQRLSPFGKFLRSTSLDELPSLWNVLKGEMSLVGPRPLLEEYLPLYSKVQARRHDVKPGVTGWAQINGRNALSWDQKFKLDVWYVDNQSFLLDIKILWMTMKKVLIRDGVSAEGVATMTKFTGSPE